MRPHAYRQNSQISRHSHFLYLDIGLNEQKKNVLEISMVIYLLGITYINWAKSCNFLNSFIVINHKINFFWIKLFWTSSVFAPCASAFSHWPLLLLGPEQISMVLLYEPRTYTLLVLEPVENKVITKSNILTFLIHTCNFEEWDMLCNRTDIVYMCITTLMLCNRTDIVYMCITTLIFIKKLSFHVFRTSIYSCWFSFRKFLTFSVRYWFRGVCYTHQ